MGVVVKYVLALAVTILLTLPASEASSAADQRSRDDLKKDFIRPSAIPFPGDNGYSETKAQLGQMLFFDPRLSGSNWISCASCHNPGLSWGDGMPHAIGNGMKTLARRTPTILNLAWADLLMWDGRKTSLEDQAVGPMTAPAEMNATVPEIVAKLDAIPAYKSAFAGVFGNEGVSGKTIAQAIATYERTVVSGSAPFDRWIGGDEAAISEQAKHGFDLFAGKANCTACHSGWDFTDHGFHDIGMPDKDVGRAEWLKLTSMEHAFKTPTLRDVARRAPYMHDGSMPNLAAVIEHYDQGGLQRPSLSDEMHPLHLTEAEKQALVAFMQTLTAPNPPVIVPVLYQDTQTASR